MHGSAILPPRIATRVVSGWSPSRHRFCCCSYRSATGTIEYVATDDAGNTSTSTRTVIVESPATAEPAPTL